jgi:FixJ family two-component response regulator
MQTRGAPIVFVVDDDTGIRETLSSLLRSVGLTMQGFASTAEFLAHPRTGEPSCLVLDVRLPGVGGLELQRQLSAAQDPIPIIFITGHGDITMSVRAIKAGAVEFLPKPFRDQDLLDAIQAAIDRDRERWEAESQVRTLRDRYETLTPRERQVMATVLTGQLNKQISAVIGTSESTVKAHRMHVMQKMGAASVVDLIRMADMLGITTASAPAKSQNMVSLREIPANETVSTEAV